MEGGVGQFGSGWVWIQASPKGELSILQTGNGDTALLRDGKPITGCDVWEHAYYLDYKNDRKAYLEAWFDGVLNWDFAGRAVQRRHHQRRRLPIPQAGLILTVLTVRRDSGTPAQGSDRFTVKLEADALFEHPHGGFRCCNGL